MPNKLKHEGLRKEWEESEVSKRVCNSELHAMNHGYPQWQGVTIPDWWLSKIGQLEQEAYKKGYEAGLKQGMFDEEMNKINTTI